MRRKCLSFSLRMIVIEGVCSLGIFFHKYTSIMRHKNPFFVPFSLNIGHTRFLQKNKLETFRITNNSKRKQPWDTQEKGTVLCKKMSPNHHHPHTHTCLRMYKIVRGKQFNKDPLFALCLFHLSIIFLGSAQEFSQQSHFIEIIISTLCRVCFLTLSLLPKKKCVFTANS